MPTATAKPRKPVVDVRKFRDASNRFKLAGDPTRLRVLLLLAEGERNVTEMCDALGVAQPALSHHAALLRHSGIVKARREGKSHVYSLTEAGEGLASAARAMMGGDR
jgi:DNA-binding transcriptional ArsR family regulator